MPNHLHGILIINNQGEASKREEASHSPTTISDVICSFKSKCSMEYLNHLKQNNIKMPFNIWQRSFYDHIIRNEKSLYEIRKYIQQNPLKWEENPYYPNQITPYI